MFQHPALACDFEPPQFSEGIPARTLRVRRDFFPLVNDLGLLPPHEWEMLKDAVHNPYYEQHPEAFWDCMKDSPVIPRTCSHPRNEPQQHYARELWRKAKALNRGRNVLACVLAHVRAMKQLVEQDLDLIVEDNVRMPFQGAAEIIWKMKEERGNVDMEYYGWLGSLPNLEWILQLHRHRSTKEEGATFDFPMPTDITEEDIQQLREQREVQPTNTAIDKDPGGTALIWGAYAYWVSPQAYQALFRTLKDDIGALLWKRKNMRHYQVKPIDKILPRIIGQLGQTSREREERDDSGDPNSTRINNIRVAQTPVFFRAPMLTSKIHSQWDPGFCQSTCYQLQQTEGRSFHDLWLTLEEQAVVKQYEETGEWKSMASLSSGDEDDGSK